MLQSKEGVDEDDGPPPLLFLLLPPLAARLNGTSVCTALRLDANTRRLRLRPLWLLDFRWSATSSTTKPPLSGDVPCANSQVTTVQ
jgi:hypothetical protein